MTLRDAHPAYEDASTPDQMHADCQAATRNLRIPQPRRIGTVVTGLAGAAPKKVAAPLVAVTDRVAKLAGSILD